ncbi:MAG: creatininase family protein [Armatimonadetes bacterium]|nr:creatininase family protein [Armatimonadota bacterium]
MWDQLDTPAEIYLPYMTREAARKAVEEKAVLLVPVAAIEQHGPHGPLHTDIDNVLAVCVATARHVDPHPRCVVAAPVWFSISPFDVSAFPGTIRLREEIFKEALGDVLESYIWGGFRRIAVVNGHGGGTEWMIPEVVHRINRRESHLFPGRQLPEGTIVVTFMWLALLEVFAQDELMAARGNPEGCADWHGGDVETALQLYLRPGLVDMDAAVVGNRYQPLEFAPYDIGHSWYWQYVIAGYPPGPPRPGQAEGFSGDPTLATAETGRRVLELAAEVIGRFVREFASR